MPDLYSSDCLSFGDALFLHLERQGAPLHVAALCIFDGVITLDETLAHIEAKLPLIPRYLQRVIPAPFGLGMPMWQHDPGFNVRNHLREIRLKRGTDADLQKAVSEVLSHRLDRQKPLWEFVIISGLQKQRTAMLVRVHHCLADGISGVRLLNVMMDTDPNARPQPAKAAPQPPPPPRDQATLLMDSLVSSWFATLERMLKAESQLLQMAQQVVANAASPNGNGNGNGLPSAIPADLTQLLPEFGAPPDRLPFNVVCRGPQSFEWTELPFDDIRRIKRACDGTVNDVVLTLIAMTVRRYTQAKKVSTSRRVIRVVVPVNVRSQNDTNGLGNQITFVPVTVPLGVRAPKDLLQAIRTRTEVIKKLRLAEMVSLASTVFSTIPTSVQMAAGPIASQLPLAVCNFICTNVPGPQQPLYLLGHELLSTYPYVPIGGEMGMNCAILSYNGKLFVGFTCDAPALPDSKLLPQFLQESFTELKKAAGLKTAAPTSRKRKPRKPKPRVTTKAEAPASAAAPTPEPATELIEISPEKAAVA